jgi:hypothetical protein
MTLANQTAQWSLSAKATSTAKLGSGSTTIGTALSRKEWSDADIVYGFEIKAAASADVATLTLSTGAVVKTDAGMSVTRWGTQTNDVAGNDFEGVDLPTLATLYGLLIETNSANDKYVTVACSDAGLPDIPEMQPNSVSLTVVNQAVGGAYGGTVAFTFEADAGAANDIVTCTVIGKA